MRRRAGRAVLGAALTVAMLAAGVGVAAVVGVGQRTGGGGDPAASGGGVTAPAAQLGRRIDTLATRLRTLPGDWPGWAALGAAYVEQARITGDPTSYPRAESAFAESLRVHPDGNDLALAGQASLAAARHDFPAALRLADAALAVNELGGPALGVRADALVELGRYPEAWQAAQRMVDVRPDVSSLARASYAFELRGEVGPAEETLRRVLADASSPADVAFAWLHLGELARDTGDLAGAEDAFGRGLVADPSSAPLLAGRAHVEVARGRADAALATTDWPSPARRSRRSSSSTANCSNRSAGCPRRGSSTPSPGRPLASSVPRASTSTWNSPCSTPTTATRRRRSPRSPRRRRAAPGSSSTTRMPGRCTGSAATARRWPSPVRPSPWAPRGRCSATTSASSRRPSGSGTWP
ncbi:tetratricopeptide repeat protein [Pseudofrankia asymbiotica]|uniref:tetratricopeptide repeat protein n=1 Tax=Pseudofrankia asymbiotica TaxID=1834516 RepID=UPI001F524DA7|nr:tetratricopeptide repeat protein [Pseudofrankia asymbiotica]